VAANPPRVRDTRRSIEDICLAHGTSPNTLRRRVKAWGWRMRRPPMDQGPAALMLALPHSPSKTGVNALLPGEANGGEPSPHIAEPPDPRPIGERLQAAVARVLPAIEATLARLAAGPISPREMEFAARTIGLLTRTLRELNGLLAQHKALEPKMNVEELRRSLARKLEAIIAERDNPSQDATPPSI
jgi:hypothetical protein